VWVKFPVALARTTAFSALEQAYRGASIVIWTTTPWTIPGNRAISYSPKDRLRLYEVTEAPADNWAKAGDR
jgi:isoleucyl-tRNA synthetase